MSASIRDIGNTRAYDVEHCASRLSSSSQANSSSPRTTAGSDARVGCEPGQVRKEAALNSPGSVPSCPRSSFAATDLVNANAMRIVVISKIDKPGVKPAVDELVPWIRQRADLVAVGTHGRSGLSRAVLGSVAEWVIRAAVCDVLVERTGAAQSKRA